MNRKGRKWLHRCAGVLIAASVFGCFGQRAVYAEEEGITKKNVDAYIYGMADKQEVELVYTDALPNVPYIDAADYLKHIYTVDFSEQSTGDGIWQVKNENGVMTVDVNQDTVSFDCYENMVLHGINETDSKKASYEKKLSEKFVGSPAGVTLDYAGYGIDLLEIDGKLYFPLPTIADLYAVTDNTAEYVDGSLYFVHSGDAAGQESYYDRSSLYNREDARDEAEIGYTYSELCFAMDHFYGMSSGAEASGSLKEKGFDQTLDTLSDDTRKAKEFLLSEDPYDYLLGFYMLSGVWDDGGHTLLFSEAASELDRYPDSVFAQRWNTVMSATLKGTNKKVRDAVEKAEKNAMDRQNVRDQRDKLYRTGKTVKSWKNAKLVTYSGTAVFVIDSLEKDVAESFKWSLDYSDRQGFRNFVLDISAADGSSTSAVNYILAMITNNRVSNESVLRTKCMLSGNVMSSVYSMDLNLDGAFDAKDKNVGYSFNYAVMTTRSTYSMGNLLAVAAKEKGILLLGENSGGGAFSVSRFTIPDAGYYQMSTMMKYLTGKGKNPETGAVVDYKLPTKVNPDRQGNLIYRELYLLADIQNLLDEHFVTFSEEWVNGKWYGKTGRQTYRPVGSWKKVNGSWRFTDTSGWYAENCWQKIDGEWYFFEKSGAMVSGGFRNGYYFEKSGVWDGAPKAPGWKKSGSRWWYSLSNGGYLKKCWMMIDGTWYYFDKDGYLETDAYRDGYYLNVNGVWNGKKTAIGWKEDDTGWWYSLTKGEYLKECWKMIDGRWYYFHDTGYAARGEYIDGWWLNKGDCTWTYKFRAAWYKSSEGWRYGDSTGWYAKDCIISIDQIKCHFDSTGTITDVWPLPSSHYITSEFGYRVAPTAGATSNHKGVDIGARMGADVFAAVDGRVSSVTSDQWRGKYVDIYHGGGLLTRYQHLSRQCVNEGEYVYAGDKIGEVGSTGVSTGPHLHFEVHLNDIPVNPLEYFGFYETEEFEYADD